jgi:hypothetical protein
MIPQVVHPDRQMARLLGSSYDAFVDVTRKHIGKQRHYIE